MKNIQNAGDRGELLRRLRAITPQSPRRWGRMTPHQMVCHLCDSYRLMLGQRTTRHVGNVLGHTVIKWLTLYTAIPVPKGISTTEELDQERGGTRPAEFTADVETLAALMEASAERNAPEPNDHPFFGPLSRREWARFNYRHTDHHLRQFGG